MPTRADIEAGRAFVSLNLEDAGFQKGIAAARRALLEFGASMTRIGLGITTFGAAVSGPLGAIAATNNMVQASLKEVAKAALEVGDAIAATLAPGALETLDITRNLLKSLAAWVRENGTLVRSLFQAGKAAVVFGTSLIVLGKSLQFLSSALGQSTTVMRVLTTVTAVLTNPIGLLVVGLGAAVAAWLRFTETGQKTASIIGTALSRIFTTATQTIQGIQDALVGGDFELVGKIMMAGLQTGLLIGLEAIAAVVSTVWTSIVQSIADTFGVSVEEMSTFWGGFVEGLTEAFQGAARAIITAWQAVTTFITKAILNLAETAGPVGDLLAKVLGIDIREEIRRTQKLNERLAAQGLSTEAPTIDETVDQIVGEQAAGLRQRVAAIANTAEKAATGGIDFQGLISKSRAASQAELARFRAQAAAGADAVRADRPSGDEIKMATNLAAGSFSAAALAALGQGLAPEKRTAKATEESAKLQAKTLKILERHLPGLPKGLTMKNTSGSAAARFDILGIDGIQITPTNNLAQFQDTPVLKGVTPATPTHFGLWALCLEPIANNEFGRVFLSGVTPAKVDIDDTDHLYCDIANSSKRLTSNWYGAAEILTQEAGTGDKWCLIRMGLWTAEPYKAVVTESGGISAGGSGSVDLKVAGSTVGSVTAHLNWMEGPAAAAENDECLVKFFRDDNQWTIINKEC